MTTHGALSVIVDIKQGITQSLIELLEKVESTKEAADGLIPFKTMNTIHFARFVVIHDRNTNVDNHSKDKLSFTTNFDFNLSNHISELIEFGGKGLWKVFSHCVNFPEGEYNSIVLREYLSKNNQKADTFYVGVGYRSVTQIRNEKLLRKEIENFADANHDKFIGQNAVQTRNDIIEFIHSKPDLTWARVPETPPSFLWNVKHYGKLIIGGLLLLLLLIVLLPLILVWVILILIDEIKDKPARNIVTKQHVRELLDRETGMVQAQFSAFGNLKPGIVRYLTMSFLLKLVDFLAPYLFSKGKLSGIPTVHFARWLLIDKGKQMLFLSNYDGNSESYLRDFINIAGKQLTLLFSHTIGYPKTYLMIFGGAKDAKKFMEWARCYQTVTNVWYSANKDLSVKNIYNNSEIRNGLYGHMEEKEALKWLSLI